MDSTKLGLSDLAGRPEIRIVIGGEEFRFSELPVVPQKAALDEFLRIRTVNPMEAVKPHLAGLDPEDRRYLLNEARKEAKDWPPCLETSKGRLAIVSNETGLHELFFQALTVHHPAMTREKAASVWSTWEREQNALGQESAKRVIHRLIAVLFNLVLLEDEEGLPKESSSQPKNGSTGSSSSVAASVN